MSELDLWRDQEINRLRRDMDRMFNRVWGEFGLSLRPHRVRDLPAIDLSETENAMILKAELPGIDKKDISVDIKHRVLTVKGERNADHEVKEDKYYRRERVYGKFERSFTLPASVDPEQIKADYNDGVLKIEVPKPAEQKPRQISVN